MLSATLSPEVSGAILIFLGLTMIASELFSPSHGSLAVGGGIGILAGAAMLTEPGLATTGVSAPLLLCIAIAAVALIFVATSMAAAARRRRVVTGKESMIGAVGSVLSWDGGIGHVFLHGERWQARGEPAVATDSVRVIGIDGLTLEVVPATVPGSDQEPERS